MKQYSMGGEIYDTDVPQDHHERQKIADAKARDLFPELADVMDIRNTLMKVAEKIPGYQHEGSGAGIGGADFRFYLNGRYYLVTVEDKTEDGAA